MSASSTLANTCMCFSISGAMINSSGVWNEDATVWTFYLRQGVKFQPPLGGTLHLGRTNAFFLGGGKALLNSYYRTAERLGIEVAYDGMEIEL